MRVIHLRSLRHMGRGNGWPRAFSDAWGCEIRRAFKKKNYLSEPRILRGKNEEKKDGFSKRRPTIFMKGVFTIFF